MDYKWMNHAIYIRVDKGEPVTETIREVCRREGVQAGYFQGIGACDRAELSTWIEETQEFVCHERSGMLEMVSLMGNISMDGENRPFIHSHAVFSYLDGHGAPAVTAGHLKEARISYTGEIVLTPAGDRVDRMIDPETGIEVWKLR